MLENLKSRRECLPWTPLVGKVVPAALFCIFLSQFLMLQAKSSHDGSRGKANYSAHERTLDLVPGEIFRHP